MRSNCRVNSCFPMSGCVWCLDSSLVGSIEQTMLSARLSVLVLPCLWAHRRPSTPDRERGGALPRDGDSCRIECKVAENWDELRTAR